MLEAATLWLEANQDNVWFKLLVGVGLSGFLLAVFQWFIGRFFIGVSKQTFLEARKPTQGEIKLFEQGDGAFDAYLEEHKLDKAAQKDLRQTRDIWHYHQNLENPRNLRRYENSLGRMLRLIAKVVGDKPKLRPERFSKGNVFKQSQCFSVKSYEFCLGLALVYPLLFAFLNWLGGSELQIGGAVFLEAAGPLQRLLTFTALVIGGVLIALARRSSGWRFWFYCLLGLVIIFLGASAGVFAGVFAVAFAFAVAVAVAVAGAVAGAVAFAVAVAFAFAGAFVGAFTATSAVALLADRYYSKSAANKTRYWFFFNLFSIVYLGGALALSIVIAKDAEKTNEYLLLPVFLGLLPLLNAFMDWCSLNLTRKLLLSISSHHSRLGTTLAITLFDLLAAVFFVFAVTALVVCVLAGVNALAYFFTEGQTVLDFSKLMADIKHPERWQQSLWVHFMVLSTLVPTLLHFIFALFAIALWPLNHWHKKHLSKFWQSDHARAAVYSRMRLAGGVSLFIFGGFIYLGYLLLSEWWLGPAQLLWKWADIWLRLIDPAYLGAA